MNLNKKNILFSIAVIVACVSVCQYYNIFSFSQIANSEEGVRKTEEGVRKTEDGVRKTEDGVRKTEDGVRKTEDGVRKTEDGVRKPINKNNGFLTCASLSERTNDFLKYHYVYQNITPELSKRTLDMFIKILDPGKLYFRKDDINEFLNQEANLFKKINNVDCRLISGENGIYERYKKRINEATNFAKDALNEKIDFSKDEYIETDRKKVAWVNSNEELKDRWRKTIKFIVLNLKDSDDIAKIKLRLNKRYEMIRKDIENRSTDDIYALFLNAFALSLDPHSSFLTPSDNAQFQMDFSLKFVGIGATLKGIDGYTIIDAIVPGGAAAKDGRLKKNDKIVAVDAGDGLGMQDVIEMDLAKVVQLIRGKEGTTVKLVISRKGLDGKVNSITVSLKRAIVQVKDSEAKSEIINIDNKKIGVINLPSFYIDYRGCQDYPKTCRSSSNDMYREIKKLKAEKIDGLIVDLRKNGGGDLSETQKIVGLFIKNPIVTQIEDRAKEVRILEFESNEAAYTGPLAILVSKYTASASEILSGAVQDYGRGIIVGNSRTFGKGTVQTVIEVPGTDGRSSNGAIHVTIAKFFRPSGKSNQEKGILSDIIIPDIIEASEVGEKENDYALPYTYLPKSREIKQENDLKEIISKLQKKSRERVEKSAEFSKVIAAYEKISKDKNTLVSLKDSKNAVLSKNSKSDDSSKVVAVSKNEQNTSKEILKAKSEELGLLEDDDSSEFSSKVIRKNDIQLKESANILVDEINLYKLSKKE